MTRFPTPRGRVTGVAVIAALVPVGVATVAFNLLLRSSLHRSADNSLRSQAAAASTTVSVAHGRVRLHESPGDAAVDRQVWIYQGHRAVERAAGNARLQRAADGLAGR